MDNTRSKAKDSDEVTTIFDVGSLSSRLPQKRKGLSKYFSGKTRSFGCLNDAKSIEDLKKAEIPEAKRRKYSDRQQATTPLFPTVSCRNESNTRSYQRSFVGV